MKISKVLILGMLVSMLCMGDSVYAASLADDLLADGTEYRIGDTVCYTISLTAFGGDLTDVSSYLFVPTLVANETCDGANAAAGGTLIVGPTTLVNGVELLLDCGDTLVLAYEIQPDDYTDSDGPMLTAKLGTEATDAGEPDCDQETKTVTILPPEPNTLVTIEVTEPNGPPGYLTNLIVTETNTGLDPLTNVQVTVSDDAGTIGLPTTLTAPPDSGDAVNPGVLDVGETWQWTIGPFAVNGPTTYEAIGSGVDVLGNVVSWPDFEGERATTTAEPICEPCISITKTVDCSTSKVGDEVTYEICIENCSEFDLDLGSVVVTDPQLGGVLPGFPDVLAPGQPVCLSFPYTIQESDEPGPIVNQARVEAIDLCDGVTQVSDDSDPVTVTLVHPSLLVTKNCINENQQVDPGGIAIFEIRVENNGDVCLDVTLVDPCDVDFDCGPFTLAPGQVETCQVEIDVPEDTTATEIWNSVTATWTICVPPRSEDPPCLLNEEPVPARAKCDIPGGMTRTPGFWKTHTALAEHVLEVHVPGCGDVDIDGCINLGWIKVCDIEEFCAVMWANKSNNTDGSKRSKLCQAQMHASFHALAAILNDCSPSGGGMPVDVAEIASILGGNNRNAIQALASELAAYNESGDDVALIDPDGPVGSATPQECKGYDQSFADCINGAAAQGKGKNK
jgi:uncharacterized repeat protein (TIGR01451 family)